MQRLLQLPLGLRQRIAGRAEHLTVSWRGLFAILGTLVRWARFCCVPCARSPPSPHKSEGQSETQTPLHTCICMCSRDDMPNRFVRFAAGGDFAFTTLQPIGGVENSCDECDQEPTATAGFAHVRQRWAGSRPQLVGTRAQSVRTLSDAAIVVWHAGPPRGACAPGMPRPGWGCVRHHVLRPALRPTPRPLRGQYEQLRSQCCIEPLEPARPRRRTYLGVRGPVGLHEWQP